MTLTKGSTIWDFFLEFWCLNYSKFQNAGFTAVIGKVKVSRIKVINLN